MVVAAAAECKSNWQLACVASIARIDLCKLDTTHNKKAAQPVGGAAR